MSRWIALIVTLGGLGLAACDGETTLDGAPLGWGPASSTLYTPPASGSGILGDWFVCQDQTCAVLGNQGLRFEVDGTWSVLRADGQGAYVPGQGYCLYELASRYDWDGTTLTMHGLPQGGDLTCTWSINGEIATMTCLLDQVAFFKRVTGDQVEQCPIYANAPASS